MFILYIMKRSVKQQECLSKKKGQYFKKRTSRKKGVRKTKKFNVLKQRGGKKDEEISEDEKKDLENYTANYFFDDENITNQPNTDTEYKECGIVHLTESQPINAFRGITTGIANFFGNKGFDNPIFDYTRNEALQKLKKIMENKKIHKICNLRMDVDNSDKSLFVINLFGTALRKSDEEESESPKEDEEESESPKEDEEESESPNDDEEKSESPKEEDVDTPKTWRPKN